MFADDDIKAEPGWVEAVVRTLENPKIALVGGNNYPLFEEPPPEWLVRWWDRPVYKGRALGSLSILDLGEGVFEIDPGYVWGCNYSIRRESLLKAGGFHPDSVPKERLLFRETGKRMYPTWCENPAFELSSILGQVSGILFPPVG